MRKREAIPGRHVYHRPSGRYLGVINRTSADGMLLHLVGTDQGIATIHETTIGDDPVDSNQGVHKCPSCDGSGLAFTGVVDPSNGVEEVGGCIDCAGTGTLGFDPHNNQDGET